MARTTAPAGTWALSVNVIALHTDRTDRTDTATFDAGANGRSEWSLGGNFIAPAISYGITDRLQLGVLAPGVAYRFGDPGDIEWIPSIQSGFSGGYGRNSGALFAFTPSIALDVRRWLGPRTHLTIGALARSAFSHRGGSSNCSKSASELCVETTRAFETWRVGGQLAFTHTFGRTARSHLVATPVMPSIGSTRRIATPRSASVRQSARGFGARRRCAFIWLVGCRLTFLVATRAVWRGAKIGCGSARAPRSCGDRSAVPQQ